MRSPIHAPVSVLVATQAGLAASIGCLGDIVANHTKTESTKKKKNFFFLLCIAVELHVDRLSQGAQLVEQRYLSDGQAEINNARTARLAAFRAFQGPLMEAAWRAFDVRYAILSPARQVAAKVVSDQILLMPPFTFLFFCSQAILDGSWNLSRAWRAFPESLSFQWPFWCVMHTLTFGFIPPTFRVVWFSAAAVFANGYLSFLNEKSAQEESLNGQPATTLIVSETGPNTSSVCHTVSR